MRTSFDDLNLPPEWKAAKKKERERTVQEKLKLIQYLLYGLISGAVIVLIGKLVGFPK